MHDIINFLKGAVLRGDAQKNIMSSYHFGHELVTARNESLQAGIYMESPISFVAPAAELEAVLSRIKAVSAVNLADNTLTLKGGRVKASISCIDRVRNRLADCPSRISSNGAFSKISSAASAIASSHPSSRKT